MNSKEIARELYLVKVQIKLTKDPVKINLLKNQEKELLISLKNITYLEVSNEKFKSDYINKDSYYKGRGR